MTFIDFLDELLSERNFLMDKTIGDNRVVRSDWPLCMGYELRRETIKNTTERCMAIQEALWAAYRNDHHRLENCSNPSSQSADKDTTVQQLQKKVADLERQMRSRSHRGRQQQLALPSPMGPSSHELALPAPSAPKDKAKGKGKGRNKQLTNAASSPRFPEQFVQHKE